MVCKMKQNDDSTDESGQSHKAVTVTMNTYISAAKRILQLFNLIILRKALKSQRTRPICS